MGCAVSVIAEETTAPGSPTKLKEKQETAWKVMPTNFPRMSSQPPMNLASKLSTAMTHLVRVARCNSVDYRHAEYYCSSSCWQSGPRDLYAHRSTLV